MQFNLVSSVNNNSRYRESMASDESDVDSVDSDREVCLLF